MAFALFRTESDQRINVPIRTNMRRLCLARAVRYQAKGFSSPRNPIRAFPIWRLDPLPDFPARRQAGLRAEAAVRFRDAAPRQSVAMSIRIGWVGRTGWVGPASRAVAQR